MQVKTLESINTDDEETENFLRDHVLRRIFLARKTAYHRIENYADHKVTFGPFPEEDMAFIERVTGALAGICLCVTSPSNLIGLMPERVEIGDHFAIVEGRSEERRVGK